MTWNEDVTLEVLVTKFEGLRPSVRTWNLMHREGFATAKEVMTITETDVLTWRNHNEATWPDIQVLQDGLRMVLSTKERQEPTRSVTESFATYAIRMIQWETWWQAHDNVCPRWWNCNLHSNPHEVR